MQNNKKENKQKSKINNTQKKITGNSKSEIAILCCFFATKYKKQKNNRKSKNPINPNKITPKKHNIKIKTKTANTN